MEQSVTTEPDEGLRAGLHGMWSAVAGGWAEHADFIDARGEALTQRMLELAAPRPGERVLELACGPAGLGLAAAELVGPGGEVVLSDVAPEMTAIAAARAAARELGNVTTCVLDIERIEQPGESYDVVLCRDGLMFAPDPGRGAREMRRVLRPGGRLVLAVWGPRVRNPWLGVVFDCVSAELGHPVPPPGIPGPFSLEDADRLAALLSGADLADVAVSEFPVPMRVASFDEWWGRTTALAGPVAKMLEMLPEPAQEALRTRARTAAGAYETAGGLEFPGVGLVATATRR